MPANTISLYPELADSIKHILKRPIPDQRKEVLTPLIDYARQKLESGQAINLHFICTHNSRRSQLAQIWAQTAAVYFGLPVSCYSGGVEVTAFNPRAVKAIVESGFRLSESTGENPVYTIHYSRTSPPIHAFSKLFDDPSNPSGAFAAVMTCSDADQNCPFIPGAEKRIPVRYQDPKEFDGTAQEGAMYWERSQQIAAEMFYVFSRLKP